MNKLRFLAKFIILALVLVLGDINNALAQHDVYLQVPNSVPSYCQETGIWCGAATGQMILEGYHGGVEHPFTQTHVWNRIVAHRDDPGVNWATDPDGLKDTLMEIGGDPGVSWNIFHNSNAQSLMYSVTYWMTQRRYPTAVLVYGFQHWVMIDGFTTDVNPTTNTTVNLQFIEIVDPWNPPCPAATSGGVRSLMSGSNWYSNYWYTPGNIPASKWNGNYIAVIEPPLNEGLAKAPRQVEEGGVISEGEAIERAVRWIKEFQIEKRKQYEVLKGTKHLKPLLVNQKHKGYYIVPLGYRDGELTQGAILVNAYNGDFQEVGVFQKPIKYLPEDQARRIALNYLCACKEKKERIRTQLIFQPSEQTQSRFMPLWAITIGKVTLYVTQEGKVFERLTPLPLGD
ncbi:MAG: hypothetical protein Fur0020_03160 [Thermodesulfovibrionia bacterium]